MVTKTDLKMPGSYVMLILGGIYGMKPADDELDLNPKAP